MTRSGKSGKVRKQFAALPWRETPSLGLEVLLITSRETGRWVVPKGWPIKGLSPGFAALREAFEEAGVEGYASQAPVGCYLYDKRLATGALQPVRVEVFAMQVSIEHDRWPEQHERERLWSALSVASTMVDEPDLGQLIAGFSPT